MTVGGRVGERRAPAVLTGERERQTIDEFLEAVLPTP